MKREWIVWAVVLALLLAMLTACGPAASDVEDGTGEGEKETTTASGLQYTELEAGEGPAPQPGDIVSIHIRGMLEDGTEFDSTYSRDEPIQFALGQGMVLPGWDEGIALMKVGEKARLVIPPELAFGEQGYRDLIPPDETLTFEVELLEISPGAPLAPTEVDEGDYVTTGTGLKYYDLEVGDGATPQTGQIVAVHYTGWLEDGTKFDSSLDRGQPFTFPLGMRQVIAGWDEGVATMKVGGRRQLVIPPELGYGSQGSSGVIPPNATLIFEVELLAVQ